MYLKISFVDNHITLYSGHNKPTAPKLQDLLLAWRVSFCSWYFW